MEQRDTHRFYIRAVGIASLHPPYNLNKYFFGTEFQSCNFWDESKAFEHANNTALAQKSAAPLMDFNHLDGAVG